MKRREEEPNEIIRFRLNEEEDGVTSFRKKEKKHEKGFSGLVWLALILFFLFCFSLLFLVQFRQWTFDPAYLFENISRNFSELFAFIFGTRSAPGMQGRFMQCLAAIVTGAALASCGAVLQGSFKNQLAGPSTMGVMTGGTLGCLAYLLIFTQAHPEIVNETHSQQAIDAWLNRPFFQMYAQQLCVFAGCILSVVLILGVSLAAGKGKVSGPAMIISGTVFSAMTGNLVSLVQYYMIIKDPSDERIDAIRDIMLGNFNDMTDWRSLGMLCIPILICLAVLIMIRNRLNLLQLGEDEARVMGMNVGRYRILMILLSTILTACVVSFCGRIGFLGFMIPLVARKIAGPDMKYLVPASMLLGGGMMLLIFDVAYFFGMQDSLNVFTSSVGCLVMIYTLISRKGGKPGASFQGRGPQGMGMRP